MKRIALFTASLVLMLSCFGCELFKKRDANTEPQDVAISDVTDADTQDGSYTAPQPGSGSDVVTVTPDEPVRPAPVVVAQTHTVVAGDTLYSISRRYYGDGKYWQRIWQANRDKVKDPSVMRVGTVLTIP